MKKVGTTLAMVLLGSALLTIPAACGRARTAAELAPPKECADWAAWKCTDSSIANGCMATCGDRVIKCNNGSGDCAYGIIDDSVLARCETKEDAFDDCGGCEDAHRTCAGFR